MVDPVSADLRPRWMDVSVGLEDRLSVVSPWRLKTRQWSSWRLNATFMRLEAEPGVDEALREAARLDLLRDLRRR